MEVTLIEKAEYPMALIYLADPEEAQVAKYLTKSQVYGLVKNQQIIGVCVLQLKSQQRAEIMNVAILEELQGQGLGRYLLEKVITKAKEQNIKELEIATGDSGFGQLHLYQSLGFKQFAVIPNYFIEHYAEPIFENGVQCKDQVWLKQSLE